jgi:hypothetical protein
MTHTTSEKLADVALGVAATGAAYYILKTPSLRRMAWRFAVIGLTRTLPGWFRHEVRSAWQDSGRSRSAADLAISRRPA